jgi:hypothetical protein
MTTFINRLWDKNELCGFVLERPSRVTALRQPSTKEGQQQLAELMKDRALGTGSKILAFHATTPFGRNGILARGYQPVPASNEKKLPSFFLSVGVALSTAALNFTAPVDSATSSSTALSFSASEPVEVTEGDEGEGETFSLSAGSAYQPLYVPRGVLQHAAAQRSGIDGHLYTLPAAALGSAAHIVGSSCKARLSLPEGAPLMRQALVDSWGEKVGPIRLATDDRVLDVLVHIVDLDAALNSSSGLINHRFGFPPEVRKNLEGNIKVTGNTTPVTTLAAFASPLRSPFGELGSARLGSLQCLSTQDNVLHGDNSQAEANNALLGPAVAVLRVEQAFDGGAAFGAAKNAAASIVGLLRTHYAALPVTTPKRLGYLKTFDMDSGWLALGSDSRSGSSSSSSTAWAPAGASPQGALPPPAILTAGAALEQLASALASTDFTHPPWEVRLLQLRCCVPQGATPQLASDGISGGPSPLRMWDSAGAVPPLLHSMVRGTASQMAMVGVADLRVPYQMVYSVWAAACARAGGNCPLPPPNFHVLTSANTPALAAITDIRVERKGAVEWELTPCGLVSEPANRALGPYIVMDNNAEFFPTTSFCLPAVQSQKRERRGSTGAARS